MEAEEIIAKSRELIADVIIDFNLIEFMTKEVIAVYISSEKNKFVSEILLNNLIVNMSSKVKILRYIISEEKIKVDKNFLRSFNVIMLKRNMLAHSETLNEVGFDVVDVDVDWSRDGSTLVPIYDYGYPEITTISEGKVSYESILKVEEDFKKYFEIARKGLNEIKTNFGLSIEDDPYSAS